MLRRYRDIIDLWPTDQPWLFLADDIGVEWRTVRLWRERDSIPPGYWQIVVAAARRRKYSGVTLAQLAVIAAQALERQKRRRAA